MARFAVFASGTGTNFESLAHAFEDAAQPHQLAALFCDRRAAPVLDKAQQRGIPAYFLPYSTENRAIFEKAAITILRGLKIDLVVLAGFMRVLTRMFIDAFPRRIVNIHPSLLPAYPGTHAIERSFDSKDNELGVTIHLVDEGLDSGEVIARESFIRTGSETLAEIEARIHSIEHSLYPAVVRDLLDRAHGS
jgi:phosphoribosylglycinamide formyltransferase 1